MQIEYTSNIRPSDGVKAVVFGGSGVGKTRLCATAPNPLIFSAEHGLLSLRKEKVPYIEIDTYKKLWEAAKWTQSTEAKKYGTFCLDSLSEIAEVVLGEEMKKTADPRKAYGNTQQEMYNLIRYFRGLENKNVVMIAKEMLVDVGTAKCAVAIMPSEKLQAQLPYFFDLVLHLYVGVDPSNGQRFTAFHTQSSINWQAKDRSGNLAAIEYPDLTQLFLKACA